MKDKSLEESSSSVLTEISSSSSPKAKIDKVIRFHSKLGKRDLKVVVFPAQIETKPYEMTLKVKDGEH